MPFIPHTEDEIRAMLDAIGAPSIEALFDEIPAELRAGKLEKVPERLSEMEVQRLMRERAEQDGHPLSFIGAGAYEHHIPAAVWEITTRGEFYSAYTPYQAEASQGTLQLIYEYQSMIASLTGMDASNASLYDGASALAEAVLMAVRAHKSARRVLMPATVHPIWRRVVHAIVRNQGIELVEVPYDRQGGFTDPAALEAFAGQDFAALVIPQPNVFGVLEDMDALTDWAHANKMLAIAVANPTSLALLKAPGHWGGQGADICVGEGQPLGIPLSSGGPYFGFMSCKMALVRQMPGRIVGATTDLDGKRGYTLTLQAREQHIRRAKATSNICTNQGLMVTAATIYMSLMGPEGLERVAAASHAKTRKLVEQLRAIPGVEVAFDRPVFHEAVIRLPRSAETVLKAMEAQGVLGGFNLKPFYPELGEALLVCATETKTDADLARYVEALRQALDNVQEV
ncbi:aminomethyl-transferring glycine dehydrogenase subunit GcvPA [Thermithiobacillus plumbiphilus]|uniref:Probable glycine dehydrogenase (decarboxylating) subunit 1 n=1 Tax=Thermithiobacillus plumbiphilus TaxID=1729899 RepID=A0ABU9D8M4_9PROT